jgi:ankyrin repeat protein
MRATKHGHGLLQRYCSNKGRRSNLKTKNGQTPLICAAEHGHETIVRLLLEEGLYTIIIYAVMRRYEDIVKVLLKNGSQTEHKNNDGDAPLSLAAKFGC